MNKKNVKDKKDIKRSVKGVLVDLDNTQLQELGEFKKGCCFILKDSPSEDIMFLKPKDGKKHEYTIPSLQTSLLQHISDAIQAFLKQEGKNRTCLIITDDKAGVYKFFTEDSIFEIGRKISNIRVANLKV